MNYYRLSVFDRDKDEAIEWRGLKFSNSEAVWIETEETLDVDKLQDELNIAAKTLDALPEKDIIGREIKAVKLNSKAP